MIEYGSYTIRHANYKDAPMLKEWWNDGEVMQYFGYPYGMNVSINEVEEQLEKDRLDSYFRLIIEYNRVAIGETYYQVLDEHTAKIGIRICKTNLRDKGLGKTVLSMLISHLFEVLNFKYVTVTTGINNHRARHVYERLGFIDTNKNSPLPSTVIYKMEKHHFISFID